MERKKIVGSGGDGAYLNWKWFLYLTRCDEMRALKVGDENKLKTWQAKMKKVKPNVRPGDQIVIFSSGTDPTLVYLNDSSAGEVDDPSSARRS